MRNTIIIGGAVLLIGAIAAADYFSNSTVSYESTRIEQSDDAEVIATSTPEYPEEWLEEAEAAKEAVLEKKKLEAERKELQKERSDIDARIQEIEKELSL